MKTMSVAANFKSVIRAMPIVGDFLSHAYNRMLGDDFENSSQYWEKRYRAGNNSGPGSYGRLAEYKADVINKFLRDFNVSSMIEFGCGDGAQLSLLDTKSYVGVDVSPTILEQARKNYAEDSTKSFLSLPDYKTSRDVYELALSLDVIYHLVEDQIFDEHMTLLLESAEKYVMIYSSNKNMQTGDPHVRHRKFTDWIDQNAPNWKLIKEEKNPYEFDWRNPRNTSFADFYIYQKRSD